MCIRDRCRGQQLVNFEDLREETGIDNQKQLEDLLVEMIYAEILKGKINQKEEYFKVYTCASRDYRQEELPSIKLQLQKILRKVEIVQNTLAQKVDEMNTNKSETLDFIRARDKERIIAEEQGTKLVGKQGSQGQS
eukprot:TRINITY_DN1436_c0_g1_i5.p1 TRINITY_DN1436_c0_g1~~TRINITY_DN1436_c0_g1_i5.p1  ORF type:complete len:136 (-),score=31.85 TRINITY_DN1436_c0_g1_i5:116-523(-)